MEIASTILGAVVESLMVPVKKHFGYLFLSTEYVRKLGAGLKQLEGTSVDVKNHKDTNDMNTLEIPARVPDWLDEVAKIKSDVESLSSNGNGCFNMKARYQRGRNAWKTTQEIERLLQEGREISWTDAQKPLGRVYTKKTSTSATSSGGGIGDDFKSRDTTFKDALKLLQQDQKTQMIALCGMGGVGKTTMMEQLKKVVKDKKMFDWIVKVVIGKQPNWHSIQTAIAENLGSPLTEEIKTTRADRLHIRFEEILKKSEKGILVIMDDVWEKIELSNVGLSPLQNGVKLLITSRYEDICKRIAVQGNLDHQVLKVNVLENHEAFTFFCQITNISKESDPELYQIGGDIVNKCSCLPLAIKLIAPALISEEKSIWKDSLARLRNNDIDQVVHEIIKISYDYLKYQEDKETFLLCGLFPEDSNILIEDLTRYAWGLKLLNKVPSLGAARDRIKTCVRDLKNANLLIDGDFPGCVKMHDLVLAFVLDTVSKGDHASIIYHGEHTSNWSSEEMCEYCERISLTCESMCELPIGFKCPNLSLLKLMHGDSSFKFPEGFFENTEKLEVIVYEKMQYPLLPRSLKYSSNLRMLCLHKCSLMFDCSFIGDLINLEVLSITKCGFQKLPFAIGNLQKLKVLELTGCLNLVIDDGVLKRLVKLEELYMLASNGHAIMLTDANVEEFIGCSKNLTALAIVLNVLPKNISVKKLERFKISLGCNLGQMKIIDPRSRYTFENTVESTFENTLRLITNKYELLESRIYQLFEKTEVLYLQVDGVTDLGVGLVESLHNRGSSFYNLRVLEIRSCPNLTYLFTARMANGLTKLERLIISLCSFLETVVDGEESGVGVIKFQALKFLSLEKLPKLSSLCNTVDVIELPQLTELQLDSLPKFTSIYPSATSSMSSTISERQSFFKEEDVIPKLEKLHICQMQNLKEIWPCQFGSSEEVNVCLLREIIIEECDGLVNLFPSNPMSLLHHLEELTIWNCGLIEVLFNIDMRLVGKIEEIGTCLRSINVRKLDKLREVWRIKGANNSRLLIGGFEAVKSLDIVKCKRFINVFTPTTVNFDMSALARLIIRDCGESERDDQMVDGSPAREVNVMSNEEISEVSDVNVISDAVFSSNLIHTFHHIRTLGITNYKRAKVMFEIDTPSRKEPATTEQPLLLPYLMDLELEEMDYMSHVWKFNCNKILSSQNQKQERSLSSFHNLTTIYLERCQNIKYLFSPLIVKLLRNLKKVTIKYCDSIEEVVSNRDDEDEGLVASTDTNPNLFPHLDILVLEDLFDLERIGGGEAKGGSYGIPNNTTSTSIHDHSKFSQSDVVAWSLCQYIEDININDCRSLEYVVPSYALGQMHNLKKLHIAYCVSLMEVFETQGFNINGSNTTNIDEGSGGINDATMVPRMKNINMPQLSNLKKLGICECNRLQHVFTFSMLESLVQLEELMIRDCKAMKVIVKEDGGEQTNISSKIVVIPRLKSIDLRNLPNLMGFFLGKNEFHWPVLDDVIINACQQMMVFTSGPLIARKLNYICKDLNKYSLECGSNFPVTTTTLRENTFSSLDTTNSCATTSKGTPFSFRNLIELFMRENKDVKNIIPSTELLHVQNLEKIYVSRCTLIEELFEALEETNNTELQSIVVEIPKLREVKLDSLKNLKYIWKYNPWIVLEFPKLTKVSIEGCDSLEHVFSSSMVGSLLQLQEVSIRWCTNMEVIIKEEEEEESDGKANGTIKFPNLKSLRFTDLPKLKGLCLRSAGFSWPSLDILEISGCKTMRVFTKGYSATPMLKAIDTSFGRCELEGEEGLNSFLKTKLQEGLEF